MHCQVAIGYARSIDRRCKISQRYLSRIIVRCSTIIRELHWRQIDVAFCWGFEGIMVPRLAALPFWPIQLHGLSTHTRRAALEPS